MPVIKDETRGTTERPAISIQPPTDRALASLWELAELEYQARDGSAPETASDWRAVEARYHELVTERRGELAMVREVTRTAPSSQTTIRETRPTPLRATLVPFAAALAAVLTREPSEGVTFRVVSGAGAVEPMRALLARIGLTDKKRIGYRGGATGASWYDDPSLYIAQWTNAETAIVVKEDASGPAGIEFDMRVSHDTFRVVYRIGDAPGHAALLAAYWDLGIRRSIWEFHETRTPRGYVERVQARYAAMWGCDLRIAPRGDGWVDYTLTMEERPL